MKAPPVAASEALGGCSFSEAESCEAIYADLRAGGILGRQTIHNKRAGWCKGSAVSLSLSLSVSGPAVLKSRPALAIFVRGTPCTIPRMSLGNPAELRWKSGKLRCKRKSACQLRTRRACPSG